MARYQKKTQIYMSDEQWTQLQRESGLTGSSVAEVVRISIEEHLHSRGGDAAGFEAALGKTAGIWKTHKDMKDTDVYVRKARDSWQAREERNLGGRVSD